MIFKYENRKLYDKELKGYVTLKDLFSRMKTSKEFKVIDNVTSKDITNEVKLSVLNKFSKELTSCSSILNGLVMLKFKDEE